MLCAQAHAGFPWLHRGSHRGAPGHSLQKPKLTALSVEKGLLAQVGTSSDEEKHFWALLGEQLPQPGPASSAQVPQSLRTRIGQKLRLRGPRMAQRIWTELSLPSSRSKAVEQTHGDLQRKPVQGEATHWQTHAQPHSRTAAQHLSRLASSCNGASQASCQSRCSLRSHKPFA